MNRAGVLLALVIIVSTGSGALWAPMPASGQGMPPGWEADMMEVVVELAPDEQPTAFAPYLLSRVGVPANELDERVNHVYTETINGFSVYLTPTEFQMAERMFGGGDELGVEVILEAPILTVPDLSLFGVTSAIQGKPLRGDGLVIPTGLLRTETPLPETPGTYANVDVAVIDTGVDAGHGQLNVVGGIDCTAEEEDRDSYGFDPYGHGTHVAGTIAASYGATGVVGMAPGARVWDVRVLDAGGGGSLASIICGVEFVAAQGIPIANMSLGGSVPATDCGEDDPLHNAVCVASEHTTFVVAAGNAGRDAADYVPASYDEVVTVSAFTDFDGRPGGGGLTPADRCSATSHDDELAAFGNYGPAVDIAAPGVCILSTASSTGEPDGPETYVNLSGTSMSAPHVAGAFARWLAVNPGDEQREHMAEVWIEWSERHGTARRYDGSHTDRPAPLLYVGEMPGSWQGEPQQKPLDPINFTR